AAVGARDPGVAAGDSAPRRGASSETCLDRSGVWPSFGPPIPARCCRGIEEKPRKENRMNRKTVPLAVALAAIATSIAMPVAAAAPTAKAAVLTDGTLRIDGS